MYGVKFVQEVQQLFKDRVSRNVLTGLRFGLTMELSPYDDSSCSLREHGLQTHNIGELSVADDEEGVCRTTCGKEELECQ